MSGGHFNYQDSQLKNEMFGYDGENKNPMGDHVVSEIVYDVLDLIHHFDWYISGDTGREDYDVVLKAFKEKWLKNPDSAIKKVIEDRIGELRKELLASL